MSLRHCRMITVLYIAGSLDDGARMACDEKGKSVTAPNMKHEK